MILILILWKLFKWLSHSCGIIFITIKNPALQKVFSNVGVLYQGKKNNSDEVWKMWCMKKNGT